MKQPLAWAGLLFCLGGAAWSVPSDTLVYSTNPQYPPYDWAIGDEAFAGASIDLLPLVLPPGTKTSPLVVPWKRAQEMAKYGGVDLLLSLRITPERSTYLDFTTHRAFPNPIVIFTRADTGLTLETWENLKGHLGGVSAGDTFGGGFDEYWRANLRVEEAPTVIENFKKLDAGRIDWFVTGLYLGQAYLATHPTTNPIRVLSPPISNGDIHLGFSKASPWKDLLPEVSRRLEELDREGTLVRLLQENLTEVLKAPVGSFPGE